MDYGRIKSIPTATTDRRHSAFRGADQVAQGLFRSPAYLSTEQEVHQATPPPGREVEVSIEPDEGSAFLCVSEGHVFVIVDAEGKAD